MKVKCEGDYWLLETMGSRRKILVEGDHVAEMVIAARDMSRTQGPIRRSDLQNQQVQSLYNNYLSAQQAVANTPPLGTLFGAGGLF
jgi:hypothetical protein